MNPTERYLKVSDMTRSQAKAQIWSHKLGHERMGDTSSVSNAIAAYASATLLQSIGGLAFQIARQASVQGEDGWSAHAYKSESSHKSSFLIFEDDEPGGALIQVEYEQVFKPEIKERMNALFYADHEKLRARGIDSSDLLVKEILKKGRDEKEVTEEYLETLTLKNDPSSYVTPREGHPVKDVSVISLDLDNMLVGGSNRHGVMRHLEKSLSSTLEEAEQPGYNPGKILGMKAVRRDDHATVMLPLLGTCLMPEIMLSALSGLLRKNGYADEVEARERLFSQQKIWTSDVSHYPDLESFAYALVHENKGFVDRETVEEIRLFSAEIAAHDISLFLPALVKLSQGLIREGYDGEKTFDCNDLRDIASVRETEHGPVLITKTQHGTYYVLLRMSENQNVTSVHVSKSGGKNLGSFSIREGQISPDMDNYPEYTIRNVRDMNNAILSLSSVACVFEEENPDQSPDPFG